MPKDKSGKDVTIGDNVKVDGVKGQILQVVHFIESEEVTRVLVRSEGSDGLETQIDVTRVEKA